MRGGSKSKPPSRRPSTGGRMRVRVRGGFHFRYHVDGLQLKKQTHHTVKPYKTVFPRDPTRIAIRHSRARGRRRTRDVKTPRKTRANDWKIFASLGFVFVRAIWRHDDKG